MNATKPVDILGFLWKFRRYAAIGLVVTIVAVAVGMVVTRKDPAPSYRGISLLMGQPGAVETQPEAQFQSSFYTLTMGSFVRMATTDQVLGPVASKHGTTTGAIQPRVTIRLVPGSRIIEIRYRGDSAEETKTVLDEITASLITETSRTTYQNPGIPVTLVVTQPASFFVESSLTPEADAAANSLSSKAAVIRLTLVGGAALVLGIATTVVLALIAGRRKARDV